MTATQTKPELLVARSLSSICASEPPSITIYLPACHPGAADAPRANRLKTLLQEAAGELTRRRYQGPVDRLLAPLSQLARAPEMLDGHEDEVMFQTPSVHQRLRLPAPVRQRLVVAAHPHITPLLPMLSPEHEFWVLAIAKKHLRLCNWRDGDCSDIPLPASIPNSLEAAGQFDQPDHNRMNRSAAGVSTGHMGGVSFGTSSDRERVDAHLHDYFRLVDRELRRILNGALLVVAGVEYELAVYRQAAEYPRLLTARPASPEHMKAEELGARALEIVMTNKQEQANNVLEELRETAHRDQVARGVRAVLGAARHGRVHRMLIAKNYEYQDLLGTAFPIGAVRLEGEQDLVNAAAVETLRSEGEVYVLDPQKMADDGPVAAILRY